jgi:hypothetical protein
VAKVIQIYLAGQKSLDVDLDDGIRVVAHSGVNPDSPDSGPQAVVIYEAKKKRGGSLKGSKGKAEAVIFNATHLDPPMAEREANDNA